MPFRPLTDLGDERWRRMQAILDEALEMPAAAVAAFLDRACPGDAQLRADIEALLEADEASTGFLERPAVEGAQSLFADSSEDTGERPAIGARIGAWRLVSEIGRGGMGAVYLAERAGAGFEQRAALKLIKRGLDTEDVLKRFERERRILARLEHKHIARLVDGGVSADGLPWFAMEYVEGKPITDACDSSHLGVRERLRLFRAVCEAVQYAHRSLVVHRDIKPSNVFVTAGGEVKLLDFGIARLLDDDGADATRTQIGRGLLTPQYAAPEQIRGEEATTATDIYGLGVVLYELLAGARPHDRSRLTLEELRKRVLDEEPAPPSAVRPEWRHLLRGDLDNIVLTSLRKEPQRRYPSVEALVADLERFEEGLPVSATPPSLRYRAGKFARRNRAAVAAGGLIAFAILAGLLITMWETLAIVAVLALLAGALATSIRQTRLARREAKRADEVRGFLTRVFEVSDPSLARGQSVTARELLDSGAERIETELQGQPLLRAEMLGVLGDLYLKLGLFEQGLPLAEKEIDLLSTMPRSRSSRRGDALRRLGNLLLLKGDWEGAEAALREAADLHVASRGEWSAEYAEDLDQLAGALRSRAKLPEAEQCVRRSLEIRKRLFGGEHNDVAASLNNLALMMREAGRLEESETHYRESLRIRRLKLGRDHPDVASTLNNFAVLLRQMGRFEEAAGAAREALEIQTKLYGEDSAITIASEATLGALLQNMGRTDEAETRQRRVVAYWDAHGGRDHPNAVASLNNLAAVLRDKGELAEAETLQRETVERWRKLVGDGHPYFAYGIVNLAAILRERGSFREARDFLERALEIRRRLHGEDHAEFATVVFNLAQLEDREGRLDEAERLYRTALELREKHLGRQNPGAAMCRAGIGSVKRRRGDLDEAQRELNEALAILSRSLPRGHRDLVTIARELERTTEERTARESARSAD